MFESSKALLREGQVPKIVQHEKCLNRSAVTALARDCKCETGRVGGLKQEA